MAENKKQQPVGAKAYLPIAFALVMVAGMQIGYKLYENLKLKVSPKEYTKTFSKTETINEVFNYVQARYVDTVNNKQMVEDVIEETLNRLDPHSNYISADEIERINESLQGNLEGIGIEFSRVQDTVIVITTVSDGPSEKQGVLAGDKIVSINGENIAGIGLSDDEVIAKLKGKKGSSVKVGIKRINQANILEFDIVRDRIPINSLETAFMLDNEIGYIRLNRFSATTYDEFAQSLLELQKQGLKKLIFDLRQNPGGYLDAATKIADEIIDGKKLLVYTEGRNYARKNYFSKATGIFEEGELVILIDQGSASASEILAGAVQDLDRGLVIGRRSFGKGLVQEQYKLSDGSALRLTVARYFTPSGRSIQKPYSEGEDAYNDEVSERYENGELFNRDSIKLNDTLKYATTNGRTVYGGGGIMPDVYIPIDSTRLNTSYLLARSYVPGFVYQHFSKKQTEYLEQTDLNSYLANFQIDGNIINEFWNYLKTEKVEIKTEEVEQNIGELKNQIKAYIARQLFKNRGFYETLKGEDEVLQRAISEVKKLESNQLTSIR